MTDRIGKIVDAAIAYTDIIIANDTADWATARQGLGKMLANLQAGAPDHPGFERLRRFIAEQDLIYGDNDARR